MNNLNINLKNCYGIKELIHSFDFTSSTRTKVAKAYAIYAPNGLMKTSFARTFENLSKGQPPKEERYNHVAEYTVECDGSQLPKESIFVLKSEIDISSDSPAMTNILVNPESKARYDALQADLSKLKAKLLTSLNKSTKVKKDEIQVKILADFREDDFSDCVERILTSTLSDDLSPFVYDMIFDPKAIEVINSNDFVARAKEFSDRYQELFTQDGTIYTKGIFNPTRADVSFSTLEKNGFFSGGHKVHLKGDETSVNKDELNKKIELINAKIDNDESLKKIRLTLAKNAQTQALTNLIETLTINQIEYFLENTKKENIEVFRKNIWKYNILNNSDAINYVKAYSESKDELKEIETEAAIVGPRWVEAVSRFNDRFTDMPFTIRVSNLANASLGLEEARLIFRFTDGIDSVEWKRNEIKTLSQGEKRVLYLLNFIFEVESRKLARQETLFVIDDIADSFDYKNKHAIIEYLNDLANVDFFYQLILTHNYDFYRSIANVYVNRQRCLMANKNSDKVTLIKAEGIKNYFIGKWKDHISESDTIVCATIPFVRNLIEYTSGESDSDYLTLTSLLHWKQNSDTITIGQYHRIYNRVFNTNHDESISRKVLDLLINQASIISANPIIDGLCLEDKVLMSIAIRLQAEKYMINKIRDIDNNPNYWCEEESQFGYLLKTLRSKDPSLNTFKSLEKVSITVSSNIHLNSFMYEPIIDLTIEHLNHLYNEIVALV